MRTMSVLVRVLLIAASAPALLFSQSVNRANPNTIAKKARLLPIDLATLGPSDTITVAPGVIQVRFTDLIPNKQTLIKLSAGDPWSMPPLNPVAFPAPTGGIKITDYDPNAPAPPPDPCVAVKATLHALDTVSDEKFVAAVSAAATAAAKTASQSSAAMDPTATTGCPKLLDSIVVRVDRTEHIDQHTWHFGFSSTEVATVLVQVQRLDETGKILKSWNVTLREQTGAAPSWFVTYGYSVAAMAVIAPQKTYESKGITIAPAAGTSGNGTAGYSIILSKNQEEYRPTPMALYHYTGNSAGDGGVENGPTAGLGFSTSSPASGIVLLVGWSVIVHRNLAFSAGMTLLPGTHLGVPLDDVTVAPTATTINVQQYQWHPFVGASFRFGSNPFAAAAKPATAPTSDSVVTPKPATDTTKKVPPKPAPDTQPSKPGQPAPTTDPSAQPAPVQKPRDG
jgi:hypothetical protein